MSKIQLSTRKFAWLFFICVTAFISAVDAQEPPIDDGEVFRVTTNLVQTDVMVFDKQGRFVEGLKPEQFELRVDNKPQVISFFEAVAAGSADEAAKIAAAGGKTAAGKNRVASSGGQGRVVFFFLDDLRLSPDSVKRTREMISRFVESEMNESDAAAIVTASGQLGVLQQLTGEKAVLRLALKRFAPRPYNISDAERTPMTEFQAMAIERNDHDVLDYFVRQLGKEQNTLVARTPRGTPRVRQTSGGAENRLETLVRARARAIVEQSNMVTRSTLATLENLLRASAVLPARKIFFFISDGFFLNPETSDARGRVQQIADAAARSGTLIYSIQASGLTSGIPTASEKTAFDVEGILPLIDTNALSAAQEPLNIISRETGGRALFNTNDAAPFLRQIVNETANYYLLAWQPEADWQKGEGFRSVSVSVKGRDDLTVRFRRGFINQTLEAAAKNKREADGKAKKEKKSPLVKALQSLYPQKSLPVSVAAGFVDNPPGGLTLTVSLQVESESIGITATEARKTDLEIIGAVLDADGKAVSDFEQSLTVDPSRMTKAQLQHIVYSRQTPVAPGLYQIRVAVRDEKNNKTGSASQWLEIPDLKQSGFALGSLFIGEIPSDKASQAVINVNRRFVRDSRLLFQTVVYNAAPNANAPDVILQTHIYRSNGELAAMLAPRKLTTGGVADLTRISFEDDFDLKNLAAGSYTMQLTATDRIGKAVAVQRASFVIE